MLGRMKIFKPKEQKPYPELPPEWTESTTFVVAGFEAAMSYGPDGFHCEWSPRMPGKGDLSLADFKNYQARRDKLLQRVADRMGRAVSVVE